MKTILIIGASSAIAEATARAWAAQGSRFYLLGRSDERLQAIAADLKVRGAESVQHAFLDANDFPAHAGILGSAADALGGVDVALVAHGSLGDQKACERDFDIALKELNTNAISVMSLLTHLANIFEGQRRGTLAVIGSVAGDRGRQSNYVYGTAKSAVATFMQGVRHRLHPFGVHVLTIKPGLVDTPMTAAFDKGPLWASPDRVARSILAAIERRADVAYVPRFWWWIMLVIRAMPEAIFKRTRL